MYGKRTRPCPWTEGLKPIRAMTMYMEILLLVPPTSPV
jgi:hypothetical protein